eukprot:5866489-Lingulodinium_polyedra.AAC.1
MIQSTRPFAAATACKPHARALHAHTSFLARAWNAQRARAALRRCLGRVYKLLCGCLNAALVLLGRCSRGN